MTHVTCYYRRQYVTAVIALGVGLVRLFKSLFFNKLHRTLLGSNTAEKCVLEAWTVSSSRPHIIDCSFKLFQET